MGLKSEKKKLNKIWKMKELDDMSAEEIALWHAFAEDFIHIVLEPLEKAILEVMEALADLVGELKQE